MISLKANSNTIHTRVALPASKSESNRALIIQALSGGAVELDNLSSARDTQTMIRLLSSEGLVLDVIDAGTTMRFLTAFCSAVGRDQILTGTPRMCQRPIGILVEALRSLGAEINYRNQEGYPPLHIVNQGKKLNGGHLKMRGNVSSQFITAILLIAPYLDGGLQIELEGDITSRPYIEMTRKLMAHFGVETEWVGERSIDIPAKEYSANSYTIESDWSAASYWYSMLALAEEGEVFLEGLRRDSWQGDQGIREIMKHFGVSTRFTKEGAQLTKKKFKARKKPIHIDFTDTPDLAQTVAVVSAATGVPVFMTGLHTLRVKETDRIHALQTELAKFGVEMKVDGDDCTVEGLAGPSEKSVETYEDHRMAMAFAPLALRQPELMVKHPEVVEKSYPEYWDHLAAAGIANQRW
ncbi:MAG: 3-phosphoshikimate 1-carboxyvinyltransferase [Bacteroidota bacterium]